MKKHAFCIFMFAGCQFLSHSLLMGETKATDFTENITYYTENFPPYNMNSTETKENEKIPTGRNTDIVIEMFRVMGSKKSYEAIKIVPWARGYKDTIIRKDLKKHGISALFSTTRTRERETLFKWVCPLSHAKNSLITFKKNKKIVLQNGQIGKLTNLKFGAIREDLGHHVLKNTYKVAESDIVPVTEPQQLISLLESMKIDVISYDQDVLFWVLKKQKKISSSEIMVSNEQQMGEHCIAFSLTAPDEVVKAHQDALQAVLNNESFMNALNERYR